MPGRDAIPPTPGEEPQEENRRSWVLARTFHSCAILTLQLCSCRNESLRDLLRPRDRRLLCCCGAGLSGGGSSSSSTQASPWTAVRLRRASPRCPGSPRGSPFPRANPAGVRVQCRRPALGPSPSCSRRHVGGGHRPGLSELLCRCGPRRRHRDNR